VTLDTDYPEVWYGLLEEYIGGMVSISNQSKKIYITTSVPYLKLPNQTASGPLYAGMISCTVEDPDGGGGGGGDGGCGAAGDVEEDTDNIVVTGGGSKDNEVINLGLTNNGSNTIVIEYIKTSWTPDEGEELAHIVINDGVVTTQNLQLGSGLWVILNDNAPTSKGTLPYRFIEPGVEIQLDFYFGSSAVMNNKDFTINLLLSDGSIKTIEFST